MNICSVSATAFLFFLGTCAVPFPLQAASPTGEDSPLTILLHHNDWHPDTLGWRTWSQRDEISPKFSVDQKVFLKGSSSLAISGDANPAACGRWEKTVSEIQPQKWYRLTAHYKLKDVRYERQHILTRLDWLDKSENRADQPEYLTKVTKQGEWKRIEETFQAPDNAHSVKIELNLAWEPGGTVWWDDIQLAAVPEPRGRPVTLTTIFHRPRSTRTSQESVRQFCDMLDLAAEQHPDVVCLPEAINLVGTGLSYVEAAEPIPGPSTKALGELAKKHRFYVVAGVLERDGICVYNTAVLIDRNGELVGKYHKVYLPREEVEGGATPGDSYPIFTTDFGKVGLMICYDLQYVDPARALASQGAEVILLPIWGGNVTLAKARAIENQVYLVTSGYDMPTFIINPLGDILVEATKDKPVISVVVDLDERIKQQWLGDMKSRFHKEWRADVEMPGWSQENPDEP
jgi:predicted amidohydrolase